MAKTTPSEPAAPEVDSAVGTKGHATPTRREREAARKRPLVAANTPEARKASRSADAQLRERARIGMQNGEEKYLGVRDRGAQKRYVRDYVDARWNLGELAIPLLVVMIVASLFGPTIQAGVTFGLYGYLALVVIDVIVMRFKLNRLLGEKFGIGNVERITMYAGMRSIQFRRMRIPKPQVKRGEYPR